MKFRNIDEKNISRAECLKMVSIEGDTISDTPGRPDTPVYFYVRVTWPQGHGSSIDKVPTGMIEPAFILSPDELIVTNGEEFFGVRHKTAEQLIQAEIPIDPNLYILTDDQLPARLQRLSANDRDHILKKLQVFCDGLHKQLDDHLEI